MPAADLPTRPGEVPDGVALAELADRYGECCYPLLAHRHGVGEPLSAEQLAAHALAALAYGHALAERLSTGRWSISTDALSAGATVRQAAAAMGLESDELRMGLREWTSSRRRYESRQEAQAVDTDTNAQVGQQGRVTPTRWALSSLDYRAHALVDGGDDPIGVVMARCGHRLPASVPPARIPPGAVCAHCAAAGSPQLRWAARSRHDERCHAVRAADGEVAVSRGWADALCGLTLPGAGLSLASMPEGLLCTPCVMEAADDPPRGRRP
ncbi:MAG: hypothetical protein ACRDT0_12380 [Pseudonocardiaceae bacterium]